LNGLEGVGEASTCSNIISIPLPQPVKKQVLLRIHYHHNVPQLRQLRQRRARKSAQSMQEHAVDRHATKKRCCVAANNAGAGDGGGSDIVGVDDGLDEEEQGSERDVETE